MYCISEFRVWFGFGYLVGLRMSASLSMKNGKMKGFCVWKLNNNNIEYKERNGIFIPASQPYPPPHTLDTTPIHQHSHLNCSPPLWIMYSAAMHLHIPQSYDDVMSVSVFEFEVGWLDVSETEKEKKTEVLCLMKACMWRMIFLSFWEVEVQGKWRLLLPVLFPAIASHILAHLPWNGKINSGRDEQLWDVRKNV